MPLAIIESDFQPRKIPIQKRAERTVKQILDTAALLLNEVGINNFNTNLLAERADVRIATVYRYFPNKLSILCTLFEEALQYVIDQLDFITELNDPANDWWAAFEGFIDVYSEMVIEHKGHLAIRRAVMATPELVKIETRSARVVTTLFAEALHKRGVRMDETQLQTIIELFLTTTGQGVDLAIIKAKKRSNFLAEILDEVKLQQKSYLGNYFN